MLWIGRFVFLTGIWDAWTPPSSEWGLLYEGAAGQQLQDDQVVLGSFTCGVKYAKGTVEVDQLESSVMG